MGCDYSYPILNIAFVLVKSCMSHTTRIHTATYVHQFVMRSIGYQWIRYSCQIEIPHYRDVIMGSIVSLITSLTSVYSTVHSGADQRKHQSSASLAFVWGIHRIPVNSSHKWPVTRNMSPLVDVIMGNITTTTHNQLWYFLWDCTVQ